MTIDKWPAWRYGPNRAAEIFENENDVPAGWQDHPSKVEGAKPIDTPASPVKSTRGRKKAVKPPLDL